MKILLLSPWENTWVHYMRKYFESKGHTFHFSKALVIRELPKYDVIFCGWADNYAKFLGDLPKLAKKYFCVVRSYEYYTKLDTLINPENYDNFLFTTDYIMRRCNLPRKVRFYNPIDLERIQYVERTHGKNVLFLGDVSFKKGIMLLVQIAIKYKDHNFFVAGTKNNSAHVGHKRFSEYFDALKPKNLNYMGYQKDLNKLFKPMHYILNTSPAEGNNQAITEGMAAGLKPIVHKFLGHEGQHPEGSTFYGIDEIAQMFYAPYESVKYRKWVEDHYDMWKVYAKLEKLITK